jgi:hypothetical protein
MWNMEICSLSFSRELQEASTRNAESTTVHLNYRCYYDTLFPWLESALRHYQFNVLDMDIRVKNSYEFGSILSENVL